MSSKNIELAREAAKVAQLYKVPMLGLPGSAHEEACKELGVEFIPGARAPVQSFFLSTVSPLVFVFADQFRSFVGSLTEFYADLQYSDEVCGSRALCSA